MVGTVPKLGFGVPQGIGAGDDGVFQHVDARTELLEKGLFEDLVHGCCFSCLLQRFAEMMGMLNPKE